MPKEAMHRLAAFACCLTLCLGIRAAAATDYARLADPLIASDLSRWFFFSPTALPEGMVNPCPDTGPSGYSYKSREVRCFSLIHFYHVVGPSFMPVSGVVDPTRGWEGWKSGFDHAGEVVEVGYHKLNLDRYGIAVECTSTERVACYTLTWDEPGTGTIFFTFQDDMVAAEASQEGGDLAQVSDRELEGYVISSPGTKVFMVVQFDAEIAELAKWAGQRLKDRDGGAIVSLSVNPDRPIRMKIGISYCSTHNARENIAAEVDLWDFDAVREGARDAWNQRLSRIEVQGGTPAQRKKFYTDLYHSLLGRGKINDVNGQFPDYSSGEFVIRTLPPAENLAPAAEVTASSARSQVNGAAAAIDGITAIDGAGEWASRGETAPWIRLDWPEQKTIGRIDLYDRVDPAVNALRGELTFSDGTSIAVDEIPSDGSTREVIFPPRNVRWLRLQIQGGEGGDVGLSELRAYDTADRPNHAMYNTDAFWWTFMNLNILWGMAWPDVLEDFIQADLLWFEVDGRHRLPRCILAGTFDSTMNGLQAVPLLATGIALDLPGFNHHQALEAMRAASTRPGMEYGGWTPGENLFDEYLKYGYVPHEADGGTRNASKTLEHSFTDWCVAQSARRLGRENIYQEFIQRSANWKNQYDPRLGYMRPKRRDGSWVAPFDPITCWEQGFTEANSVQYTWFCSHDVQGLCNLMGGNEAYCAKLDSHFQQGEKVSFVDDYGSIRMISYSNQPDLHNAHLFNYAGQPWLTQKWVRRVRELAFGSVTTSNAGYCSNDEDQGQLGSLSALMAVGLYSARGVVGDPPIYEITSPIFDRVVFHLDPRYYAGKDFVVATRGISAANDYIQSAKLNGRALDNCWFPQKEFAEGGTLELELGPEPNKAWGVDFPPPSESPWAEIPQPQLVNLAKDQLVITDSCRQGTSGAMACDNKSDTAWVSGSGDDPHWLSADLGRVCPVDLVIVEFDSSYARDYLLQASLDGGTWTDVATVTNNLAETPLRLHALQPIDARHVRLLALDGPQNEVGIREFRVFGPEIAKSP